MRMSLCRALVLLRHKNLLELTDLLQLFFDLLKCQDKPLRKFLRDHIVTDLKNVNLKSKVLQTSCFDKSYYVPLFN
jgi:protein SDA1